MHDARLSQNASIGCQSRFYHHQSGTNKRILSICLGLKVWATYSPVKNSTTAALKKVEDGCPPHSAVAAEADLYESNCKKLVQLGATIGTPEVHKLNGMDTTFYPCVVLAPSVGLTFSELKVSREKSFCEMVWN